MTAYYNEFDPHAAAWLRELIKRGLIAPGDVDDRSIEDVKPSDLRGYRQVHFFAGIGGWSLALRLAGWPDDQPVWTGSCPCQPFSAAGARAGFEDERHLWPAMYHLVRQCQPPVVFGEQVASKDAEPWIDLVHADMEGMGYAFGCVPFPAAGVGAPHIRDRNYWVADADNARLEGWRGVPERADQCAAGADGMAGGLADFNRDGQQARSVLEFHHEEHHAEPRGGAFGMADTERQRVWARGQGCPAGASAEVQGIDGERERVWPHAGAGDDGMGARPGPVNGQWRAADWLACRDGKWRAVEPGAFPLAHGLPARVVRLRGYGNAIVPAQAAEFIRAYVEAREGLRVAA